jgi:hypothetical protein
MFAKNIFNLVYMLLHKKVIIYRPKAIIFLIKYDGNKVIVFLSQQG